MVMWCRSETWLTRLSNEMEIDATLEQQISNLNRFPFRKELARVLGLGPSDDDLRAFASKTPDRFYQAVAILGKLSGFSDPKAISVEHNYFVNIQQMSDADLKLELAKSLERLRHPPIDVIEAVETK